MPQNWKTYKLGDFLITLTDYHANGAYEKLKENVTLLDHPNYSAMIRTTNFEKNDFSDLKFLDEHAYNFLKKSKVFPGDILMNKIANAGSVYFMPDLGLPVSLGMNLFLLRASNLFDQRFLFYYLRGNERYVKSFAAGSVTKTITKDAVRNLEITIPESLHEQRAIASILSSLDDKIELNLQMNKTLEEMAMTLYKHWFIDFEFPYSPPLKDKKTTNTSPPSKEEYPQNKNTTNTSPPLKEEYPQGEVVSTSTQSPQGQINNHPTFQAPLLQRRGSDGAEVKGYKSSGGKFIDSELGLIPEGWEVKCMLDIVDLLSGGTPKTSVEEYWNGDICWVSAKDIGNGGIYINDTEKKITELGVSKSSTKVLPEDTVILVARGSVGKYGMIAKEMAMNQSCYGLLTKGEYSQGLVYLMFSKLIEQFQRMAYGSVFDTITTATFKSTNVVVPPNSIALELKTQIDPLFDQLKQNILENESLTKLRDTLLPKLISGEVRVKDVEQTIGAAL